MLNSIDQCLPIASGRAAHAEPAPAAEAAAQSSAPKRSPNPIQVRKPTMYNALLCIGLGNNGTKHKNNEASVLFQRK
jgi:hypothetical protein